MRCENRIYSFDQGFDKRTYQITAGSLVTTYWDDYGLMACINPCLTLDGSILSRPVTTEAASSDTRFFTNKNLAKVGEPLQCSDKSWLQVFDVTDEQTRLNAIAAKRLQEKEAKEANEKRLKQLDARESDMQTRRLSGKTAATLLDNLVGQRLTGFSISDGSKLTLEFGSLKVAVTAEEDYSGYAADLLVNKEETATK